MSEDQHRVIEQYANGPDRLRQALRTLGPDRLDARPGPTKWSAREIALHLCDTEISVVFRLKRALAEPGSPVPAFDQDRWVDALAPFEDLTLALAAFDALRTQTASLLRRLPPEAWGRSSVHPELGAVRLDEWLSRFVGHTDHHIAQILALRGTPAAGSAR